MISMEKYRAKIWWNTLFWDQDIKHMEPIHFLKRYYGEKFAFSYLFFNHYMAYLCIPALGGVIMLIVQLFFFLTYENRNMMNTILDSEFNGYYGVGLAIWSTMFVESWRRREGMLIFEWDL